jgi:hypothetical protein
MEMRRIFCERLQKLRGCKIGRNLQLFLALILTGYDVFVKRQCGSCERTAKFGAEENVAELQTPP